MNYRHGFHAGNFADLAKHAAVLTLLRTLRTGAPLLVVDTHAGAGGYDLSDPDFARSKEAEAGIQALLSGTVPDSLRPLADYVRARNVRAGFKNRIGFYPGSPLLVLDHLRAGDDYVGCELRDDDFNWLQREIAARGAAVKQDGYAVAVAATEDEKALFYLIDPPFERPDDYARITACVRDVLTVRPDACLLIWLPLKDLETFDAWLRGMEREVIDTDMTPQPVMAVAEIRLRPLWNPMKMNGCALAVVNPPEGFTDQLAVIASDVAHVFGEAGAEGRVRLF
ncbi:23S rRNA (adenine(2030)-N(6))-methyltransferase RlmJ [Asticcacaulis sp. EMRT-3]|uniref:23S rRNA (adenine(2030)-N(6))-methyltransferase RlmJ n=1 Tax=Asticcacaulis sp. EMRT-3 TaxID=3040349 RepID=UPI0024AF8725|nr:23S rRNA (adenine(2030)-N(6))-methyltransferase RlmJ [Asticcacaulis sp. EMRT-3]MDI7774989.1 23S rRNA (adenine(2030)-N(6))-methyltransferase RlmJ [Asticcacaulis sp. EMRT-3]